MFVYSSTMLVLLGGTQENESLPPYLPKGSSQAPFLTWDVPLVTCLLSGMTNPIRGDLGPSTKVCDSVDQTRPKTVVFTPLRESLPTPGLEDIPAEHSDLPGKGVRVGT